MPFVVNPQKNSNIKKTITLCAETLTVKLTAIFIYIKLPAWRVVLISDSGHVKGKCAGLRSFNF